MGLSINIILSRYRNVSSAYTETFYFVGQLTMHWEHNTYNYSIYVVVCIVRILKYKSRLEDDCLHSSLLRVDCVF